MTLRSTTFPQDVRITFGELKSELLKKLEYAKLKAFAGNQKITESISVVVISAELILLEYTAHEEMKADLGIRTQDLKYVLYKEHLLNLCKQLVLAAAGVPEKDFSKYGAENIPYHCVEDPSDTDVVIYLEIKKGS